LYWIRVLVIEPSVSSGETTFNSLYWILCVCKGLGPQPPCFQFFVLDSWSGCVRAVDRLPTSFQFFVLDSPLIWVMLLSQPRLSQNFQFFVLDSVSRNSIPRHPRGFTLSILCIGFPPVLHESNSLIGLYLSILCIGFSGAGITSFLFTQISFNSLYWIHGI